MRLGIVSILFFFMSTFHLDVYFLILYLSFIFKFISLNNETIFIFDLQISRAPNRLRNPDRDPGIEIASGPGIRESRSGFWPG